MLAALLFAASAAPLIAAAALPIVVPDAGLPKPLASVCYSPYRDGQAPGGAAPSEAQIQADLALIAPLAKGIRTYTVSGIYARIPELARQAGLEIYVGAWIGKDDAANQAEVDALIAVAKTGNPITTADIYQDLIDHADALVPVVDFALCHVHPYWESVAAGQAAARVLQGWSGVKAKYPGKPVLVGETGFPTAGQAQGAAVPSEAAEADFLADLAMAARNAMPVMWFEAFDEAWKGAEGPVGAHWGLWNSDRSEKPAVARLRALTVGLARPSAGPGARLGGLDDPSRALRVDALGKLRETPERGAFKRKAAPVVILGPAEKP